MLYEPKQERLCILTIKSLDGLRGLAVLLVLLSHMSLVGIHLLPGLDFSGMGKAGVYLFFVLSAFLLTWQALEAHKLGDARYWTGYALRRFCRIYPLYFIVLIASSGISQLGSYGPRIETPGDILWHLALLQGNGIFWAIPVEFKYYLLLPFVALALFLAAKIHLIAPPVLALIAIWATQLIWPAGNAQPNGIELGSYLSVFLFGSLSAWLCTAESRESLKVYPGTWGVIGLVAMLTALLTIPAAARWWLDPETTNNHFHQSFLFYGGLWSLSVVAAFFGGKWFGQFFELSVCRFIGRVSFSVYLWHMFIVQVVAKHVAIQASLQFLLIIGITFGVSYISYRLIERPFISWGHYASKKWLDS